MTSKIFKVKFITSKDCFCHFSNHNVNNYPLQSCIKVEAENSSVCYFSVGSHTSLLQKNEIGINASYGEALKIKENNVVEVFLVDNIPQIKTLIISAATTDDYEVLESFSENVQNNLLSHIKVVHECQKIVIWVASFIRVMVTVDKIEPVSPGCLQNLTEVVIKPPNNNKKSESSSEIAKAKDPSAFDIFRNRVPLEGSEYIFKRYTREIVPHIFRLHPIEDLSKYIGNSSFLNQYFYVFVSRRDVPFKLRHLKSKENTILFSLKIVQPPLLSNQGFVDENLHIKVIVIRVLIVEDFVKNPQLEPCGFPIMFAHKTIFHNFNLEIGAKVILYSRLYPNPTEENIILLTDSANLSTSEEMFKIFLAENCKYGPVLLNSDFIFPLKDKDTYCSLKFQPSSKSYCLIDSECLRRLKINIVEKDLQINNERMKVNNSEKGFCLETGNFQEILENISSILETTLTIGNHDVEGVILSGRPGSGKTTLLKILEQRMYDFPYRFHFEMINCKSLKGKTLDSLIRLLNSKLINLIYYQPSVLLLDDLQVICSKVAGDTQTQESVQINRASEAIRDLFNMYLPHNQIQIIATCESSLEINQCLLPARGKKLFTNSYRIEDLSQEDRINLLEHLFSKKCILQDVDLEKYASQMDGYVLQDLVDFRNKAIFESIKENFSELPSLSSSHWDRAFSKFTALSLKDIHMQSLGDKDFSDIGGLEDVKITLVECMLWPTQFPKLFDSAPLRLQSGILLYGPPGTGKTLIAGAAAKQCNLRLISIKGPELLSKYIGASEQAVRNIFEKAQSAKPCILFFDEFDSLAPRRGHDSTGVTDRVVNQLLTQLDGVEGLSGVCVLAATSRPDLLDPALLRPGRLDKQIFCPLPNEDARLAILKSLSKSINFSPDINLSKIASLTQDYSGADLQGILCTAHLAAVEEAVDSDKVGNVSPDVTQKHLEEALSNTRPSLSKEERTKYERIYERFEGRGNVLDLQLDAQRITLA